MGQVLTSQERALSAAIHTAYFVIVSTDQCQQLCNRHNRHITALNNIL